VNVVIHTHYLRGYVLLGSTIRIRKIYGGSLSILTDFFLSCLYIRVIIFDFSYIFFIEHFFLQ
jgi:hypothetical protein